jgi:Type VII secretion system ESX-1, transport TM domain B
MHDRRDLLQAHRLMTHRMSQALLCGEPDSRNRPLRRMYTASAAAILLGVIAASVFGVLGLLRPGRVPGWTSPARWWWTPTPRPSTFPARAASCAPP